MIPPTQRLSVVTDTSHSPYARLQPVPVATVTLTDDFWAPRLRVNRKATIPSQYALLESTGRIDNLRQAAGKKDVPFAGYFFNDSDVHKWLEAVGWALAAGDDARLTALAETVISELADAQQADGYLNSYFSHERAAQRWTNLKDLHELYCAGHLIQAAVARWRATGDERLMGIARRFADLICATFGPASEGKTPNVDGHPEIEMALVELARATGDAKYLRQAQYFVDARGYGLIGGEEYHQDHTPFREAERVVGHAVRQVYLTAGATDVYAETGDPTLRAVLDRLWRNMVEQQMYLTGGVGPRHRQESFGADYELPNARAYAETCAAIAVVMWAWRMLQLEPNACYTDVLETALYNGVLSGLSLDGQDYFYVNPLASDGSHRRQPWYACACCPPNLARALAALPGYVYSTTDDGIWVNLYAASQAQVTLPDGRRVGLTQRTRYPWEGAIELTVEAEGEMGLWLRVPGWCERGASLTVNGQGWDGDLRPGTYIKVQRVWQPGDTVLLDLSMPVRRIETHPYAMENRGMVALTRGPLVYCAEAADNLGVDLRDIVLPFDAAITPKPHPTLPNITALAGQAEVAPLTDGWEGRLYRPAQPGGAPQRQPYTLTAIPYYAWANREPGQMQVWLRSI